MRGFLLIAQTAELAPQGGPVAAGLFGLFKAAAQSAVTINRSLYQGLAKNLLGRLSRDPNQSLEEIHFILRFALDRQLFPEDLFYEQLKRVAAAGEECWTVENTKVLLAILAGASDTWINSAEGPFLSVLKSLFTIPSRLFKRAEVVLLWCAFAEEQLKKCTRAKRQTVFFLAAQEIFLCSSLAMQVFLTNGHADSYELKRAEGCFVNAAQQNLFLNAEALRESFASLSRAMLRDPEGRKRILSLMKPYNFNGVHYFNLIEQLEQLYAESPDLAVLKEIYQAGFFLFSIKTWHNRSLTIRKKS